MRLIIRKDQNLNKEYVINEVTQKYANNGEACIEFFIKLNYHKVLFVKSADARNIIVSSHEMFHDVKIVLIIITYLQTQSFKIINLIFIN